MSITHEYQATLQWIKASSCSATTCLEVASIATGVAVRDSKQTAGPILTFPTPAWLAHLQAAKNGEFDHLLL